MLFQPTNIIPDLRGSLGDGVIDATEELIVSWQINGTSGMSAFTIQIFNLSGTKIFEVSDTCDEPQYGTNAYGEQQIFYYNCGIVSQISNGNEYRLRIIMTDAITGTTIQQNSMSAFITRAKPTLRISATKNTYTEFPSVINTRSCNIYAIYEQAQNDPINWVRWRFAYIEDLDNPIYDSQNIYGTGELAMKYDGLITGYNYAVKCIVETSNGIVVDSGWSYFGVLYSVDTLPAITNVCKLKGDTTAVKFNWGGFRYIYGEHEGTYEITNDGELYLGSPDDSVCWDKDTGRALDIPTPWNVTTSVLTHKADATLFEITFGERIMSLRYVYSVRKLYLYLDDTMLCQVDNVSYDVWVNVLLTHDTLYIRYEQLDGGLYPDTDLYPSELLFPKADNVIRTYKIPVEITYTQDDITRIEVKGTLRSRFTQAITGDASEIMVDINGTPHSLIDAIYTEGLYTTPQSVDGTYFLADYNGDLNAGSLYVAGSEIYGWAIYRQTVGEIVQRHIADVALECDSILDYAIPNNYGSYKYFVYPIGSTKYITSPIESKEFSISDWNYTILECEYVEKNDCYIIVNEFAFGKNLSTKDISNNNSPSIRSNFTKYPTIMPSNQNYMSGTLTSLIGKIGIEDGNIAYRDNKDLRDLIFGLSTTKNTLFLKTRKGDVLLIRIAGQITMSTMDGTREQALTATIPWAEIGSAKDCSIIDGILYTEGVS